MIRALKHMRLEELQMLLIINARRLKEAKRDSKNRSELLLLHVEILEEIDQKEQQRKKGYE